MSTKNDTHSLISFGKEEKSPKQNSMKDNNNQSEVNCDCLDQCDCSLSNKPNLKHVQSMQTPPRWSTPIKQPPPPPPFLQSWGSTA